MRTIYKPSGEDKAKKKWVLLEMLVLGVSVENFSEETEKWVCVPGNCKGATPWETDYLNNLVEDCTLKTVNWEKGGM